MSTSKDMFLARVKRALSRGTFDYDHDHNVDENAGYLGAGDDILEHFASEAQKVGMRVYRTKDRDETMDVMLKIIKESKVESIIRWDFPLWDRLETEGALKASGVKIWRWDQLKGDDNKDEIMFNADMGISDVDWAVGETGTLVLVSDSHRGRSVSLLPPIHVAFVEPKQVVPDLFDLFAVFEDEGLVQNTPNCINFITGPSKTADIELTLATGVHGPKEVHVILFEGGT